MFPSFRNPQIAAVCASQPAGDIVCDLYATTSNFSSQVAAATTGQTICLASGNYGTWTGTNKAITIAAEPGQNPTMALDLGNGDSNFTIDGGHTEIEPSTNGMVRSSSFTSTGMTITTAELLGTPGPQDITIKRCWFTGGLRMDHAANITIDRCWFYQVNNPVTACIHFSDSWDAYCTVKNCFFEDCSADGIQAGASYLTVQDCEFKAIHPHGNAALHTDAFQLFGATNCTIVRNYFHDFEQGLGAFDGTSSNLITDNVADHRPYSVGAHWISMYGDDPASTISHNTIAGEGAAYFCTSKSGDPVSITNYVNNIGLVSTTGSAIDGEPTTNTHNMWSGASSPNINGAPTFVGGSQPTTWQGYALANGSNGENAGNDGLDVGIRVS